ncbi:MULTISPECIES: LolA family protein [unclassified Marinovum]
MRAFKTLILALGVSLAALPAAAEKLSLGQLSGYLNQMKQAKGAFTQINDDGTISTGDISIRRPGMVRFDYNPPAKALVLASAGEVAIFDRKTRQAPDRYPLRDTPLNLILDNNVDLARSGMVTKHSYDGTSTTVRARDPKRPEIGTIDLVFTANPVELRQWVINDDGGGKTTVILGELDKNARLPHNIFSIVREIENR